LIVPIRYGNCVDYNTGALNFFDRFNFGQRASGQSEQSQKDYQNAYYFFHNN